MTIYIYLNGTSSCGKSTISKAICELEPKAFRVSADEFNEDFESKLDRSSSVYSNLINKYDLLEQQIKQAKDKSQGDKLYKQYYYLLNNQPLPKIYNSDLNMYDYLYSLNGKYEIIVIDDLIATPYLYKYFTEFFSELRVFMVNIRCDVAELNRREQARGDRLIGMAEFWQEQVDFIQDYDLVLDSAANTPIELAKSVLFGIRKTAAF